MPFIPFKKGSNSHATPGGAGKTGPASHKQPTKASPEESKRAAPVSKNTPTPVAPVAAPPFAAAAPAPVDASGFGAPAAQPVSTPIHKPRVGGKPKDALAGLQAAKPGSGM